MGSWKAGTRIAGAIVALGLALSSSAVAPECEIDEEVTNPCGGLSDAGFEMAWHEGLKRCVFDGGNCVWQQFSVSQEGGAPNE